MVIAGRDWSLIMGRWERLQNGGGGGGGESQVFPLQKKKGGGRKCLNHAEGQGGNIVSGRHLKFKPCWMGAERSLQ